MTYIAQILLFTILISFLIISKSNIFSKYSDMCKAFKEIDTSYDTPYYTETFDLKYKKATLKNNIYYFNKFAFTKEAMDIIEQTSRKRGCNAHNSVLAKYLTEFLFIKNKLCSDILPFSILVPIVLLLIATHLNGNVFFNIFIGFTVPFTGVFIALEKFLGTQAVPYTLVLNPEKAENQKDLSTSFVLIYLATIMSNVSANLLTVQLILGGFNLINIIIALVSLGIVLFYDNANAVGIFKKPPITTIIQIGIVSIVTFFVKRFTNVSLTVPVLFLVPFMIIFGVVLYSFTMKNLNILIKADVKTLSDKKYIDVENVYDKKLTHIAFMNKTLPSYNKETDAERKKRIEQERINQEKIVKALGFPTPKELVEQARDYRARHATMWFNGRRITPEEYDEFCKRYGYDKYAKKEESADEVEKKEKEGGYVNDIDTQNATDRFNNRR